MKKSTRSSLVVAGACIMNSFGCSGTDSPGAAIGGSHSGVAGNTNVTAGGSTTPDGSVAQGGAVGGSGTNVIGGNSSNATSSSSSALTVNCGGTAGSSSCPEGVTAMCGMLDAHNQVRAAAPGANPPIPALVWDCSIAATAQAYADTCPTGHSNNSAYGENMYWSGGSKLQSPSAVVGEWAKEGPPNYVYATNFCNGAVHSISNFNCGHYTQLVWRNTTRVGCGYKTGCSGTYSQPWVCNYAPPGNFYDQKTGVMNPPY
jgi:pathogenesis-related protein 1